jgi:hypothetical protein
MATISEDEKRSRHASMQSVLGSHAMEGLFPDAATSALIKRYEEGELTLDQFSEAMDIHAQKLLAAQRKMAGAA